MSVEVDREDDDEAPDDDKLIGQVFANRYQIEFLLGAGAMGAVYKAKHVKVGRPFAIKVLHTRVVLETKVAQRFEREAELAGRLRHPNVVGVIDVGDTPNGQRYMVMDFAEGQDLAAMLDGAPMPPPRIISLVRQLLEGLYHAHEAGLIHRDFKPENVIIERDDHGNEVPRIVDFGIAILREGGASPSSEGRLTTNGLVLGTPHYMAPEQAVADPIDHRIDLFALGIVVYEMLSGRLPFDGTGAEVARANLVLDPPPIAERAPGVDADPLLEAFARKLMAKRRDARPATAKAARELLDLIERDRPAAAAALGVTLATVARAPSVTAPSAPPRRHDPDSKDTFPPPLPAEPAPHAAPGITTELTDPLDRPRKKPPVWLFAAGGALLIGGVIAAALFATKSDDATPQLQATVEPAKPEPTTVPPPVPEPAPEPTPEPTPPPTEAAVVEPTPPANKPTAVTKVRPKDPVPQPITKIDTPPAAKAVPTPPPPATTNVETAKPKAPTPQSLVQRWQRVGQALKQHGTDSMRARYSLIRYNDMLAPGDKQNDAIAILNELEAKLPR